MLEYRWWPNDELDAEGASNKTTRFWNDCVMRSAAKLWRARPPRAIGENAQLSALKCGRDVGASKYLCTADHILASHVTQFYAIQVQLREVGVGTFSSSDSDFDIATNKPRSR